MLERRAHPRYPVGECGVLYRIAPGSSVGASEAYIVNVSEAGLGVQVDQPIDVGMEVRVDLSACVFAGTVAHCSKSGDTFTVGIKLRGDSALLRLMSTDIRRDSSHFELDVEETVIAEPVTQGSYAQNGNQLVSPEGLEPSTR